MKRDPVEAALRKELRTSEKLDPKRPITLVETGTVETFVLARLLKKIFNEQVAVTITPATTKPGPNTFRASSLEHELVEELRTLLENKERDEEHESLMTTIPEADIVSYAKRAGSNETRVLAANDDVRTFIERLQKAQPQTKASLRKTFEWFNEKTKRKRKDL